MLGLKLVNICHLNLKLTKVGDMLLHVVLGNGFERSEVDTRGIIFDKCSQIMAYPDEVVIMGGRLQDVVDVLASIVEQINKMRIEIKAKRQNLNII